MGDNFESFEFLNFILQGVVMINIKYETVFYVYWNYGFNVYKKLSRVPAQIKFWPNLLK